MTTKLSLTRRQEDVYSTNGSLTTGEAFVAIISQCQVTTSLLRQLGRTIQISASVCRVLISTPSNVCGSKIIVLIIRFLTIFFRFYLLLRKQFVGLMFLFLKTSGRRICHDLRRCSATVVVLPWSIPFHMQENYGSLLTNRPRRGRFVHWFAFAALPNILLYVPSDFHLDKQVESSHLRIIWFSIF